MILQNSFVKKTSLVTTLATVLAVGSLFFSMNSVAASECKGLKESVCDSNNSCRWVNGYLRKDGRKVNSFCRSYSGKKNVAESNKAKQKSAAVASKKTSAKTLSSKSLKSKKGVLARGRN